MQQSRTWDVVVKVNLKKKEITKMPQQKKSFDIKKKKKGKKSINQIDLN